jgi:hypothetical protein
MRHGLSLARLTDQAIELIAAGWGAVSALAEALTARGWLKYPEVVRMMLGARARRGLLWRPQGHRHAHAAVNAAKTALGTSATPRVNL